MKRVKRKTKKKLFGFGPKIIPTSETMYQKDMSSEELYSNLVFKPSNYDAENPSQRKKLAFEDAKTHKRFYDKLVKEGVYPPGTKVRVKKVKHSNRYTLEMWMPELKHPSETRGENTKGVNLGRRYNEIKSEVRQVASDFGYNPPKYHGFDNDLGFPRNYGVAKDGEVYYFDTHVLESKLPFKKRKKSWKEKNLERIVGATLVIMGFALTLINLIPSFTGYVVLNDYNKPFNSFTIVSFFLLMLGAYFLFRYKYSSLYYTENPPLETFINPHLKSYLCWKQPI